MNNIFVSIISKEFTLPPPSTRCAVNSLTSKPVTVKPLPSATGKYSASNESSGTFGFGDKFKPAEGSWQCGSCFLQNKSTESQCAACQTAKSVHRTQTNVESANSSKASSIETPLGFGEKFKPPVGSWSCDACLVQNNSEAVKCAACQTTKPDTGVKPALSLPTVTERTKRMEFNTSSSTTLGLADQFKKPEGVWDCDVCCVQNKPEVVKCVACQSAKPGMCFIVYIISNLVCLLTEMKLYIVFMVKVYESM